MKNPPTITTQRAVTSASNFFRRVLCPGSQAMESGLADEESEYAQEGTLLHSLFLTGQRPDTLTVDQHATLDLADTLANEHFARVREMFNIPDDAKHIDEREVPLQFEAANGEVLMPGHADIIRSWPEQGIRSVVDAKFGFLEVEHAADNWQLGIYAAMRYQKAPCLGISVCIVQPRNFGPRSSEALYSPDQIGALMKEIEAKWRAAQVTGTYPYLFHAGLLVAGEKQCHYCRAKAACPAYAEKFLGIQETKETAVQGLTSTGLEQLFTAIAYANKLKDTVYAEMRHRIELGQMPGWKLQNAGDKVELNDQIGLFMRLHEYFAPKDGGVNPFTPSMYDDCRTMVWGKLEETLQKLTGLSEKKVKEFIRDMSDGLTTRTPIAKRVVRDKDAAKALPAQ